MEANIHGQAIPASKEATSIDDAADTMVSQGLYPAAMGTSSREVMELGDTGKVLQSMSKCAIPRDGQYCTFQQWFVCPYFLQKVHTIMIGFTARKGPGLVDILDIVGGSTIVVLFEKGAVEWGEDLVGIRLCRRVGVTQVHSVFTKV